MLAATLAIKRTCQTTETTVGDCKMKTWTRSEIEVMAAEGDSICLRCGSRNYGTGDELPGVCEECGALAVVPAENVRQIATLVEED